jgi:hypothetical protein
LHTGYGGERFYSSDEDEEDEQQKKDDDEPDSSRTAASSSDTEELTPEERNMRNVTLKNTTFNAHAQNLRDPLPALGPPVRLGQERRPTPPIISVRKGGPSHQ